MCGTPSYLAPEVVNQTEDNKGYDQLVDSWSVGVIVFYMCASIFPFRLVLIHVPRAYRLTNTGPFIEDENEPDMRRRIAERYIDWGTLKYKRVSAPGTLTSRAAFRMLLMTLRTVLQRRTSFAACWTLIHRHACHLPTHSSTLG